MPSELITGSKGWKDLARHIGSETAEEAHQDLLDFVVQEVPEGFQEAPDFRLPQHLERNWGSRALLRRDLHLWRLEHDDVYAEYHRKKAIEKKLKKGGWAYAEQQARELFEELEADKQPPSRLVRVRGVLSLLEDKDTRPEKKSAAVSDLTNLLEAWETEKKDLRSAVEKESEEERDAAREMRTLDLLRTVRDAGQS